MTIFFAYQLADANERKRMFSNEYGSKSDPLVLLLAPMMVSGENLYQLMHPYFKDNYHFIAPDQGGHGKAGAYISADEEY